MKAKKGLDSDYQQASISEVKHIIQCQCGYVKEEGLMVSIQLTFITDVLLIGIGMDRCNANVVTRGNTITAMAF